MDPKTAVRALGAHLQDLLRQHHTTARTASEALGFHPAFLTRAFGGQRPLRVEVVFQLLARLRERPYEFFDLHYPFAGNALPKKKGPSPLDLPGVPTLVELIQREYKRLGPRPAAQYRDDLAAWLKRAIRRRKASQKQISIDLGLGQYALGLALRGNSQLTFFVVFGVVEALEIDPGRMFFEVFLPQPASVIQGLRRETQLDAIEGTLRDTERGFAKRRQEREAASKPPDEKEPKGGEPDSKS